MKVPFSWLKDYVDIDISAEELQEKLFSCGFEVEELIYVGKEIDRCATEGGMFQAIKYCNPKYTASLNKVLDALEQMELADHAAEDDGNETEHFEEETADE